MTHPDRKKPLERARHEFAEMRMAGHSRSYALAIVSGRYGVSADAVLRAQAAADTRFAGKPSR